MAPQECPKAPRVAGEGVVALVARVDRWAAQLFPTSVCSSHVLELQGGEPNGPYRLHFDSGWKHTSPASS